VEHRSLEHWFLDKQGKLLAWREWRTKLSDMPLEDAVAETAIWWKFVPLVNKSIDPWREDTWPDPWALISAGQFCPSAQGLGMFYSLILAGFECKLAQAQIDKETRLVVILPDNRLLNYYDGELVDMKNVSLQILQTWASSDLTRLVKV
jgi:hypothetical protein